MADISKVRMLNGTEYNYKDAKARSDIEGLKADLGALTEPPRLDDNTDLNSVIASGVYTLYAHSSYLNKPTQDGEHGILEVWKEKYGDTGRTFQRLTYTYKAGRTNSEIWVRSKSEIAGAAWTPWVSVSNISINDVENLLQSQTGIISKVEGSYIDLMTDPVSLTPVENVLWSHSIVSCAEGDEFVINADGGQRPRAWGFLDSSNHVLSVCDASTIVKNLKLTVPANATKLVINDRSGVISYIVGENLASDKISYNQSINDQGKALIISNTGKVIPGMVNGLSDDAKIALLKCFRNVAWVDVHGQDYYNELYSALYQAEYPKIIALFNPGSNIIYAGDNVNSLKTYLTVTYYEDEDSQGDVLASSEYSVDGTLDVGANSVLVLYDVYRTRINVDAADFYDCYNFSYPSDKNLAVLSGRQIENGYDSDNGLYLATNSNRALLYSKKGTVSYSANAFSKVPSSYYGIPIPPNATAAKIECSPTSLYWYASKCIPDDNKATGWRRHDEIGWKQSGASLKFSKESNTYLAVNFKANSTGTGTVSITNVKVTFT